MFTFIGILLLIAAGAAFFLSKIQDAAIKKQVENDEYNAKAEKANDEKGYRAYNVRDEVKTIGFQMPGKWWAYVAVAMLFFFGEGVDGRHQSDHHM